MFNKTEYQRNYKKEKLKRVPLELPIEKYNEVKSAADNASESVNGYIKKAIEQRMKRDRKK